MNPPEGLKKINRNLNKPHSGRFAERLLALPAKNFLPCTPKKMRGIMFQPAQLHILCQEHKNDVETVQKLESSV